MSHLIPDWTFLRLSGSFLTMLKCYQTAGFQVWRLFLCLHTPLGQLLMSVIYDYKLRLIKLLILILFPCICLDTKTVLLVVYLACSAPTDSEMNGLTHPEVGQICDPAHQRFALEGKVSSTSDETALCWFVVCWLAMFCPGFSSFLSARSCFLHIILGAERKMVFQGCLLLL